MDQRPPLTHLSIPVPGVGGGVGGGGDATLSTNISSALERMRWLFPKAMDTIVEQYAKQYSSIIEVNMTLN